MLNHLHITSYALIDRLDIDFEHGFSVITGETGAGKSIILGALGLLLGARADAKAIQTGKSKCVVEGTFDISSLGLDAFFTDNDIDPDTKHCVIRREVSSNGKSRAFINDTPVTLAKFKELTSATIDIHSQHQNLLLGHEHFLFETLDSISENTSANDNYRDAFDKWRKADRELEAMREQARQGKEDTDYLKFQHSAINEADLREEEQEELEREADELRHAEDIKGGLLQAASPMANEEQNVLATLKQSTQALHSIANFYAAADELAERIESARIELEDVADELTRAAERIEYSPERLAYTDERLSLIYSLEKKHRVNSISELLQIRDDLQQRIDNIENIDERLAQKEREVTQLHASLMRCGEALSRQRQAAGERIAACLLPMLSGLGMPSAKLQFQFTPRTAPDRSGTDSVTLLFSGNKSVPEQDVSQIASGGEIARLMLALKAIISARQNLPTIIFDEIDTGVSGTMAEKMAQVMQQMSAHCQVICITHLPQIAACGQQHYRVYKSETEQGTESHIDRLDTPQRIREIANMLSGEQMTEAAINNAKSLLHL